MPPAAETSTPHLSRPSRALNRYTLLASVAVVLSLTLIFFGRSLTGGQVFAMRDTAHFYYPLFYWCAEEWAAGRIPLWNPYEGIGSPVLADATSSVMYPGKLLFTLPLPFDWLFQFYIVAHFVLAAAGTWWLVREQKRSAAAATLAAIAYAFGGSVLFQYANVVFLVGAAWLPFAWGFLLRLFQKPTWRDAAWLAAVLALMTLGGDPQMVVHVAFLAAIGWILKKGWAAKITSQVKQYWPIPIAFAFAALLAAVQILPTLAYAPRTTRAQFDKPRSLYEVPAKPALAVDGLFGVTPANSHHEQLYRFSIGPWRWFELFVPNGAGRPFPRHQRWMNYIPAESDLWTPSLYMGLLPILLALGQLRWFRGNFLTRWLTWAAVLFALGSLGWYGLGWLTREIGASIFGYDTRTWFIGQPVGGLYWLLVTCVPGYVQFRYPAKLWTISALAVACLAARGFDALIHNRSSPQPQIWIKLCFATIATSFVVPFVFHQVDQRFPNLKADPYFGPFQYYESRRDVMAGMVQVAIVCAISWKSWQFLHRRERRWQSVVAWILVAITAAELAVANRWQIITAESSLARPSTTTPAKDGAIPRSYRASSEEWDAKQFQFFSSHDRIRQIFILHEVTGFGLLPLLEHQGTLRPYLTFMSTDYSELLERVDRLLDGSQEDVTHAYQLLKMLGAEDRITPLGAVRPNSVGDREWRPTYGFTQLSVSEPNPRIVSIGSPAQAQLRLEAGALLVFECEPPLATSLDINVAYDTSWRAVSTSHNRVTPLKIRRVHDVICVLEIPAGKQRIEMRYDPPEFRWGVGISIVAWSGLILAIVISRLWRFRKPASSPAR